MWTTFNGAAATGRSGSPSRATAGRRSRRRSRSRRPARRRPRRRTSTRRSAATGRSTSPSSAASTRRTRTASATSTSRKSVDDGVTFGPFVEAATPSENPDGFLPNTNFRDGIIENFTASPTYPGHALPHLRGLGRADGPVRRASSRQSTDGGAHLVGPADRQRRAQLGVDRPVPAVGRRRARRRRRGRLLRPPRGLPDRPEHPARARRRREHLHRHLAAGLQGRRNRGRRRRRSAATSASRSSPGIPISPSRRSAGSPSTPAPATPTRARTGRGFIGDYFGLAISAGNVYTFGVSTHYPSRTVVADDGGPVYYQNQVLGIVPRSTFGLGSTRRGLNPSFRR